MADDEKEIVIKVTSRFIERLIYFVVIIGLIVLVVTNPFNNCETKDNKDSEVTGAATAETTFEDESSAAEAAAATTAVVEETAVDTEEEIITPAKTLSGVVTVEVSRVTMDSSKTNKVKSIGFVIDNQKDDFIPKVEVYWYDTADTTAVKEKLKGSWSADGVIRAGQKISGTISPDDGAKTYMTGNKVYVSLRLYNLGNDEMMDTDLEIKTI